MEDKQEKLKIYIEFQSKIYLVSKYIVSSVISQNNCVDSSEVSLEEVNVSGSEFWSRGGQDYYSLNYPSSILLEDDWKPLADKFIQEFKEKVKLEEEHKELKRKQEQELNEKKKFEELKEKYG